MKNDISNFIDNTGRLKLYPAKRKNKILALMYLASRFEKGISYTEKEVNSIIDSAHSFNDRCLLRRELYDYKFIGRLGDCSKYWLEEKQPALEDFKLD